MSRATPQVGRRPVDSAEARPVMVSDTIAACEGMSADGVASIAALNGRPAKLGTANSPRRETPAGCEGAPFIREGHSNTRIGSQALDGATPESIGEAPAKPGEATAKLGCSTAKRVRASASPGVALAQGFLALAQRFLALARRFLAPAQRFVAPEVKRDRSSPA